MQAASPVTGAIGVVTDTEAIAPPERRDLLVSSRVCGDAPDALAIGRCRRWSPARPDDRALDMQIHRLDMSRQQLDTPVLSRAWPRDRGGALENHHVRPCASIESWCNRVPVSSSSRCDDALGYFPFEHQHTSPIDAIDGLGCHKARQLYVVHQVSTKSATSES